MAEYRLFTESIEVPKGSGRRGFLHTIEQILQLDKVQEVRIDSKGNVQYSRYVREDIVEPKIGPSISFETLMPYACVRNGTVHEVIVSRGLHPVLAITKLFLQVSSERMFPIAFVTGANTTLWDWLWGTAKIESNNHEELYGLPLLTDRHLDDYVLILASGYGRSVNITDVQKSYKIIMPQRDRREDGIDRGSSGEGGNSTSGDPGGVPPLGVSGRSTNGVPEEP